MLRAAPIAAERMTAPDSLPAPPLPGVRVHVHGRTDVGLTRDHNEDAFAIAQLDASGAVPLAPETTHVIAGNGMMLMVADGLGGAAAGELASEMAVERMLDAMHESWRAGATASPETLATSLAQATHAVNAQLHDFAAAHPEHHGMATTATVAVLRELVLYVAQVGDSRAYLVRGGRAWQLTRDQSLVQRLVDAGELTQEEAERSERRNIILQALGPELELRVDLSHQPLRRGDVVLLCTDGLSGLVHSDELAAAAAEPELAACCARLVQLANERGGPDNISIIAARIEGEDVPPAAPGEGAGYVAFALPPGGTPEPITGGTSLSAARALLGGPGPAIVRRSSDRVTRMLLLAAGATLVLVALLLAVRGW